MHWRAQHGEQTKNSRCNYNLKYMNQRSTSIIRKMKTDLGDEHAFERKIARAIKDKKEFISKMTTPRASQQNHNNYSNNPYIPKHDKSVDECQTYKKKQNIINVSRQFVSNIQERGGFGMFTCINHPKKRGLFQDIKQREYFYCHECAIQLVKSNIQVVEVSSESLIVKMFMQEQFQKIMEEESKVKAIIEEYYLNLKDHFLSLYKTCHESILRSETVDFGNFQISEGLNKIIENLGLIEPCLLKFEGFCQKENNLSNSISKDGTQRALYKKDRSIDPKAQSNRSLETIPQKSSNFINKTRDNSFYKKSSKIDYQKIAKYDGRKIFYMR